MKVSNLAIAEAVRLGARHHVFTVVLNSACESRAYYLTTSDEVAKLIDDTQTALKQLGEYGYVAYGSFEKGDLQHYLERLRHANTVYVYWRSRLCSYQYIMYPIFSIDLGPGRFLLPDTRKEFLALWSETVSHQ